MHQGIYKILDVLKKYTILSTVMLITSFTCFSLIALLGYFEDMRLYYYIIYAILFSIGCIVVISSGLIGVLGAFTGTSIGILLVLFTFYADDPWILQNTLFFSLILTLGTFISLFSSYLFISHLSKNKETTTKNIKFAIIIISIVIIPMSNFITFYIPSFMSGYYKILTDAIAISLLTIPVSLVFQGIILMVNIPIISKEYIKTLNTPHVQVFLTRLGNLINSIKVSNPLNITQVLTQWTYKHSQPAQITNHLTTTSQIGAYYKKTLSIPGYRIHGVISEGGFSTVFKAQDSQGRIVAIKVLNKLTKEAKKMFIKEISLWSILEHQNIVKLVTYSIESIPYLVMEYMDGSLRAQLKNKTLSIREALEITLQVALALNYAHQEYNLFHRDLKPENILYKGDVYKVSDWGLASITNLMSTSGGYVGTIAYSAPEQFDASFGGTGPWTDTWQLGVILYELISGKLPFGMNISVAIKNILYGEPEKLENIPSELWSLILDMLQKDPKRRPLMKDIIKRIKSLLESL